MFQVKPLSQQDPAWKSIPLGSDSSSTIGVYGCLLTDLAMVANGFGASETPATLNVKMKASGGFQGANVIPAVLPQVVPNVRYKRFQACDAPPAPMQDIDSALAAGQPVIVQVDYSPVAGLQSHWVILLGKVGSDYAIQDPWPNPVDSKQVLLTQRFGFAGAPQNIIKAAIWLTGTQPPPPPTPVTIPTSGFVVYPGVDGLALRQSPEIAADNLITRLAQGLKLFVTEDATSASAKIGQAGQWVQVIESGQGYPGYVAAWLVVGDQPVVTPPSPPVTPPYTPPESQPPSPAGSPLLVFTSVDGLALRSQALIDPSTLLKREPANAQLTVLEDAAGALAKLNQNGQWLNVQDIETSQGYVAAWLVSQYRSPTLGVGNSPAPLPVPDQLVVLATTDGLAFRSQPLIDPSTLIRRVPLQSEFLVLEPVAQGLAKLGQNGQWLNVQASDGVQGYVAAWYVQQRPPVGPQP